MTQGKIESIASDEMRVVIKDFSEQGILVTFGDMSKDRYTIKLAARAMN